MEFTFTCGIKLFTQPRNFAVNVTIDIKILLVYTNSMKAGDSMATIIVLLIIALLLILDIRYLYKSRKSGKCSGCSQHCSGSCTSCEREHGTNKKNKSN